MSVFDEVKEIVRSVLRLPPEALAAGRETPLLGALPEFDSLSVAELIAALEAHFGVRLDDVDAETFETLGTLADYVGALLEN